MLQEIKDLREHNARLSLQVLWLRGLVASLTVKLAISRDQIESSAGDSLCDLYDSIPQLVIDQFLASSSTSQNMKASTDPPPARVT